MFENVAAADGSALPLTNLELAELRDAVGLVDASTGGVGRLERIRLLEELKAAVAAAQTVEVAAYVTERREAAEVEVAATPRPGVGRRRRLAEAGRSTVAEVARARRESPARASRFVAFALSAPADLPRAFGLFAAGALSERRIQLLYDALSPLGPDGRRAVDADLAPRLDRWGDRQLDAEARAAVYRYDPQGACDRAARAAEDRRVGLRPAPEAMAALSALLPLPQGVAVWGALHREAEAARSAGDPRTRGQVMADTLVERVTGQATAAAVPVAVQLVMTDRTLAGDPDGEWEPARLVGHGPLPAGLARDLVLGETPAARSVRRLFTDPTGRLVTAETTARRFTPAMARFIRLRDDTCRTPWCDAPIAHADHIRPAAEGGRTRLTNGRGTCARCNYTQVRAGRRRPSADPPRVVFRHLRPPGFVVEVVDVGGGRAA